MFDKAAKIHKAETAEQVDKAASETQQVEDQIETEKEMPSLDDQLAEAQALAAEYLDGWQRARAELANYKRRTEAQRSEMILGANTNLLTKLLPVLDDLQLALDNAPSEGGRESWDEWRDGVALVAHKFAVVLKEVGVVPIETEGQFFDPNIHEAISHEPNPDLESGQIIAQIRQGYMLGDRVLRPAMVRVAR